MKQRKKGTSIPRHSKSGVEKGLVVARKANWLADHPLSHGWAVIYCPHGHDACRMTVNGTPKSPEGHARQIERKVGKCPGPVDDEDSA